MSLNSTCGKAEGLSFNTHSVLLPILCNDLNIDCQLHKRVIKFFACLANSGNIYNKLTLQLITQGNKSKMSNSFNHLSYIYGFNKHSFRETNNMSSLLRKISCHYHHSLPVWPLVFADVVKYMLTLLSKEFSVFFKSGNSSLNKFLLHYIVLSFWVMWVMCIYVTVNLCNQSLRVMTKSFSHFA